MIKDIVKDIEFLQQKSEPFVFGKDDYLIQDIIDTAEEHRDKCAGLACVQIGTPKKLIVVKINNKFVPFINPVIIKRSQQTYIATEACLSLEGTRQVKRHKKIKLGYTTADGKTKVGEFDGFTAQVIQHECDHLRGILI